MQRTPEIQAFFDPGTGTFTYLVADGEAGCAAVIDPVLHFDRDAGVVSTTAADQLIAQLRARGWTLQWILETHPHADHLSSAQYLKAHLGGMVCIGRHVDAVRMKYEPVFGFDAAAGAGDGDHGDRGGRFDRLWADGDQFRIGAIGVTVWHVPGHTPADVAYLLDGAAFVGDTLFMPDVGTARADFAGGDAHGLFRSVRRLLALPGGTALFTAHDYPPAGRAPACNATVAAHRAANIHVRDGIGEDAFVAMRRARDAGLRVPALMLPALQVNLRAGALPDAEANGTRYLKIPVTWQAGA